MLRRIIGLVLCACSLSALAPTLALWYSTGQAGFTRLHDPSRSEAGPSAADLFADTGLAGDADLRVQSVPNRFALGLLPSTYPWRVWDPHLASVATVGVPAALLGVVGCRLWMGGRARNQPSA